MGRSRAGAMRARSRSSSPWAWASKTWRPRTRSSFAPARRAPAPPSRGEFEPAGADSPRRVRCGARADPAELARRGVYTASAGNMAQGVAWNAQRLGIHCSVVVPDHAPQAKLAPVERLGARIVRVPFDTWWQVLVDHGYAGLDGIFIHPVSDPAVIAGNGTIGLELAEQLPEMTAVVVPYGGGGLACGIATAVKALRPDVRVYAAEVETAAPLAASLAAGHPVEVDYRASWVDGIGSRSLLAEIWPLASTLLDGSITVTLAEVAEAV